MVLGAVARSDPCPPGLRTVAGSILTSGKHSFMEIYRNDPKFSDRYAWANSADPDQTAPRSSLILGAV